MPILNEAKLQQLNTSSNDEPLDYEDFIEKCGYYYNAVAEGDEKNKLFNGKIALDLKVDNQSIEESKMRKMLNFDDIDDVFFKVDGQSQLVNVATEEFMEVDSEALKVLNFKNIKETFWPNSSVILILTFVKRHQETEHYQIEFLDSSFEYLVLFKIPNYILHLMAASSSSLTDDQISISISQPIATYFETNLSGYLELIDKRIGQIHSLMENELRSIGAKNKDTIALYKSVASIFFGLLVIPLGSVSLIGSIGAKVICTVSKEATKYALSSLLKYSYGFNFLDLSSELRMSYDDMDKNITFLKDYLLARENNIRLKLHDYDYLYMRLSNGDAFDILNTIPYNLEDSFRKIVEYFAVSTTLKKLNFVRFNLPVNQNDKNELVAKLQKNALANVAYNESNFHYGKYSNQETTTFTVPASAGSMGHTENYCLVEYQAIYWRIKNFWGQYNEEVNDSYFKKLVFESDRDSSVAYYLNITKDDLFSWYKN